MVAVLIMCLAHVDYLVGDHLLDDFIQGSEIACRQSQYLPLNRETEATFKWRRFFLQNTNSLKSQCAVPPVMGQLGNDSGDVAFISTLKYCHDLLPVEGVFVNR